MTFYKQKKISNKNELSKVYVCSECGGTELRWNYPQQEAVCSCCGNPFNQWQNYKKPHEEIIQTIHDVVVTTPTRSM